MGDQRVRARVRGLPALGGRAATTRRPRRLFIVGLAVFSAASLLAALAWNEPSLIGARASQGLGAAIIAPAALSILMTTFSEGRSATSRSASGEPSEGSGRPWCPAGQPVHGRSRWEWIFYINIPVGLTAIALAAVLLGESRDTRAQSFDALGAVLVTAGLSTAVFGITQANDYGWGSAATIGIFAAAVALLAGFVGWETRTKDR